jgi:hypothetical protein
MRATPALQCLYKKLFKRTNCEKTMGFVELVLLVSCTSNMQDDVATSIPSFRTRINGTGQDLRQGLGRIAQDWTNTIFSVQGLSWSRWGTEWQERLGNKETCRVPKRSYGNGNDTISNGANRDSISVAFPHAQPGLGEMDPGEPRLCRRLR